MGSIRWSDGVYAGLVAAAVFGCYFMLVDSLIYRLPWSLAFTTLGSAVLGPKLSAGGGWPVLTLGIGLFLLIGAIAGIGYALLAIRFPGLAETPGSAIGGILYGLLLWVVYMDVLMPLSWLNTTAVQPWVETVPGAALFFGFPLCEYLTVVKARSAQQLQSLV